MIRASRLGLWWIANSAVGALLGSVAALWVFPAAGFARSPSGFGGHLVGFVLTIGATIGLAQWLVLRSAPWPRRPRSLRSLVLWVPVTGLGLVLAVLPLWWLDAEMLGLLLFAPLEVLAKLVGATLPGMAALGLGQWILLRDHGLGDTGWILRTLIGASLGLGIGLVVAILVRHPPVLPLETVWAFCVGLSLGLAQAGALVRRLEPPSGARASRKPVRRA